MSHTLVDIEACRGTQQPYVMLSCATSLDGLLIIRSFDFNRIQSPPSESLRNEMLRLEAIQSSCESPLLSSYTEDDLSSNSESRKRRRLN